MRRVFVVICGLMLAACNPRVSDDESPCLDGWQMPVTLTASESDGESDGESYFDAPDAGTDGGTDGLRYQLTLNEAAGTVEETYNRNGHRYRIVYRALKCEHRSF